MSPKVSVIIPVYNVEPYLPKCLDSVINQTLEDIEIICINDCSTDNSLKILQEYALKDNRIQVITHDKNEGVSAARNSALKKASGMYVYFIDSDDWIDDDYIEVLVNTIQKTKADIVINKNIKCFINGKEEKFDNVGLQNKIDNNTFIDISKMTHIINCSPCNKLYKKELLDSHNLTFPQGYIHEDIYFHYVTSAYAKNIFIFEGPAYNYIKRIKSITSDVKKHSDKYAMIFELIYDFFNKNNLLRKNIKIFYIPSFFNIQDEITYNVLKNFFSKAGEYILNNDIYNEMEKYLCNNILNTENYSDYISKYSPNVAISYIRRTK